VIGHLREAVIGVDKGWLALISKGMVKVWRRYPGSTTCGKERFA